MGESEFEGADDQAEGVIEEINQIMNHGQSHLRNHQVEKLKVYYFLYR